MSHSIKINERSIGVTFQDGTANILVWAPKAHHVSIAFQNSDHALTRHEFGYWKLITHGLKPGDSYEFVLDHDKLLPDPASLAQPDGVHGASLAMNTELFQWHDQQWKNEALDSYILYEIHVGTFTPLGTFAGVIEKIPYLKELGITAIELMPVACFPGNRNWGYDGVYPFAVHSTYGGATGLQTLVDACHQAGIAVVLDVVYNHVGPEGNYLSNFGPYFTTKYSTPWGEAINYDDRGCDGVRQFIIENVLMWFRDFHIDALRLDAVHAIKDLSTKHILQEIREAVDELMEATGKTHYLIAELDLNDAKFISPLEEGGYGMDTQWIDEFHHALRVTTGQSQQGYYEDFNGIEHLAKAFRDAYVYDGQYSHHREKFFGAKLKQTAGQQFVVFSQNHDQVGNRMLGERTSDLVDFNTLKLLAAATLLSPYLPLLFMGEEYGETNPFLYFVDHSDPDLIEAVRKGRKAEFAAFHYEGELPDAQSEETFLKSKLQWNLLDVAKHETLHQFYKTLINIRKVTTALKSLNRDELMVEANTEAQILIVQRWHEHEHEHVYCVFNFSNEVQPIAVPWKDDPHKLFDSDENQWLGTGSTTWTQSQAVLAPKSILVMQCHSSGAQEN